MMEENILAALLAPASLEKPYLAKCALENVQRLFQSDLGTEEAYVYASLALDPADGILKYIKAVSLQKNAEKAPTTEAFTLLEYIVTNHAPAAEFLSDIIIRWCLKLLNIAVYSDKQSRALIFAKTVVNNCACMQLNWDYVLNSLQTFYLQNPKTPPTLRQATFDLIGVIFQKQPDIAQKYHTWFFAEISKILRKCHDEKIVSESSLVAAAFLGLLGLFDVFEQKKGVPFDLTDVYNDLKVWCSLRQDRNTSSRIALQLFIKHSFFFTDFIVRDFQTWVDKLLLWTLDTQTSEHKQLGLSAITVLFRVVSTKTEDTQIREFFRDFISKPPLGVYRTKVALAALSELSSVFNENELLDRLHFLLAAVNADNNPSMLVLQFETQAKVYAKVKKCDWSDLAQLAVMFIEKYPNMETIFQPSCLASFENGWVIWLAESQQFTSVLYHGLLRSCKFPIYPDVQLLKGADINEKLVSYKDFVSFWQHLLTISSQKGHKHAGKLTYDAFVTSFLLLISKLNLSLVVLSTEKSDPMSSMEANCPDDFRIFANLVDLFEEVIPKSDDLLTPRLPEIMVFCMKYAQANPLISGFAKIIATCFKKTLKSEDYEFCDKEAISRFLNWAILSVGGLKDELLISYLRMILASPIIFVQESWDLLPKVVTTSCRVGRGHTEVLFLVLEALDKWYTEFPVEKTKSIINLGLKLLAPILLNPSGSSAIQTPVDGKKVILKTKGKIKKKVVGHSESKLHNIQRRFLLFMAKTKQIMDLDVFQPEAEEDKNQNQLIYKIQMPDQSLELDLALIIPRTLDLAKYSCDRNTRFNACQILHSMMLLTMSKVNQCYGNIEGCPFEKLLTVCLSLSCDSDVSIAQLFKPLIHQTIHYYSNARNVASKASEALVDVLFEGVTHPFDSALRDFSADCLKEYIEWSKSNENLRQLSIAKYNILGVVRKICEFIVHPDAAKRQGAAVAFNVLYSKIREDKEIVKNYWLRLHHLFVLSLGMCHCSDDARLIITAIEHINRPFIDKSKLFCEPSRNEGAVPVGYGTGTIADIVSVYFKHCKSSNALLRDNSQNFLKKLVRRSSSEYESLKNLFEKSNVNYALNNFDGENSTGVVHRTLWLIQEKVIDVDNFPAKHAFTSKCIELLSDSLSISETASLLKYLNTVKCTSHEFLAAVVTLMARQEIHENKEVKIEITNLLMSIRQEPSKTKLFTDQDLSENRLIQFLREDDANGLTRFWQFSSILQEANIIPYYSEANVLKVVFQQLFETRGKNSYARKPEVRFAACVHKILKLAMKHGLQSVRCVIELITDSSQVLDDGKTTTKGEFFFAFYQTILAPCLMGEATVNTLLKMSDSGFGWIQKLLEVGKNRRFAMEIVEKWDLLTMRPLMILLAMVRNISASLVSEKLAKIPRLQSWFSDLSRKKLHNHEIVEWFAVLPLFCADDIESSNNLQVALAPFRIQMNPDDTLKKRVLSNLQKCVCQTGNLVVFRYMVDLLAICPKLLSVVAKTALVESICLKGEPIIFEILQILHKTLFEDVYEEECIYCIKGLLLDILKSCTTPCFDKYVLRNLVAINDILGFSLEHERRELLLLRKIACVNLIHVIYGRACKEDRARLGASLPSGVFQSVFKRCEFMPLRRIPNTRELNLTRFFNCSCVQLLCSVIPTMPDNAPRVLLLNEKLWPSVVDDNLTYSITMEFNRIPNEKVFKTFIKNEENEAVPAYKLYANSHTATLNNSSFSEEVRNFDLTHLSVVSTPVVSNPNNSTVSLEIDEFNIHEVMPDLCALLRLLIHKKNTAWVDFVVLSLDNMTTSRNAKLLILKIIYNLNRESLILRDNLDGKLSLAILTAILELFPSCNYFFIDLVNMLIEWKSVFADCEDKIRNLVKILIVNPGTRRKDVIRYLMEILTKVVEQWGQMLNGQEMANDLRGWISTNREFDVVTNYTHLRVLSIFLANSLFDADKIAPNFIFSWLLTSTSQPKNFQLAGECLGQFLKEVRDDSKFSAAVGDFFNTLQQNPKSVEILCYINQHCPIIEDRFISTIKDYAWREQSDLKVRCLEVIHSYVTYHGRVSDNELLTFFPTLAIDCLKCGFEKAQECMLNIIEKVVDTLETDMVDKFSDNVVELGEHNLVTIRLAAYKVMMKMTLFVGETGEKCKIALISGLTDWDSEVRAHCLEFWCRNQQYKTTEDRLAYILSQIYNPAAESDFVEGAVRVFLQAASTVSNFKDAIVGEQLENCDFKEQQILLSWRMRHSGMAALFVPSMCSQISRIDQVSEGRVSSQMKETTRTLIFSATFSGVHAFDDTKSATPGLSTMSGSFKKPRPVRFTSCQSETTLSFAKRHARSLEQERTSAEERIKEREDGLTVFRTFKVGDYPDVQITHSELVDMLSGIIGKDKQVAKVLFLAIMQTVNFSRTYSLIEQHLNDMVAASRGLDPLAVNTLFELALSKNMKVPTSEVARLSAVTGLMSIGAIMIERCIENADENPPPTKRGSSTENQSWLQLAQIYYKMRDWRAVHGVFLDKVGAEEDAKKAILAENSLDWVAAKEHYGNVLENSENSFYQQSYINCLANLSDWSGISNAVENTVNGDDNALWSDPWCCDFLLPWHIKSKMMLSLAEENNSLAEYIKQVSSDPIKTEKLVRFPAEVTTAYWFEQNVAKTTMECTKGMSKFLKDWSSVNEWDTHLRQSMLEDLDILVQLKKIIAVTYDSKFQSKAFADFLSGSSKEIPNKNSNLVTWDVKMHLQKRFYSVLPTSCVTPEAEEHLLGSQLSFCESAVHQKNINLCRNYLKLTKNVEKSAEDSARWNNIRRLASVIETMKKDIAPFEKYKELKKIREIVEESISNVMDSVSESVSIISSYRLTLLKIIGDIITCDVDQRHFKTEWEQQAEMYLDNTTDVSSKGEVYVQLAKFLKENNRSCWREVVENLLKAMQCGNSEARGLFGGVFTMDGDKENQENVLIEAEKVPVWIFLKWRQQLLAYNEKEPLEIFKSILRRIAKEYPGSLSYPLRFYNLENSCFLRELSAAIYYNNAEENFVKAVKMVANPFTKFSKCLDPLMELSVESGDARVAKSFQELDELFENSGDGYRVLSLFHDQYLLLKNVQSDEILRQSVNALKKLVDNARHPKKSFIDILNKLRNNLATLNIIDVQALTSEMKNLVTSYKEYKYYSNVKDMMPGLDLLDEYFLQNDDFAEGTARITLGHALRRLEPAVSNLICAFPKQLVTYTKWFSKFLDCRLEIPGQYDSEFEPFPKKHILISSFVNKISVMPSKTEPVKVTIIGNDARKYHFLLKFGEDLRQDERIQQCLSQMKDTLNPKAIGLETYSVIPVSPLCGLIQWVSSSKSLETIMETVKPDLSEVNANVRAEHLHFLAPGHQPTQAHMKGYSDHSYSLLIKKYEDNVKKFDPFMLRSALWNICSSSEHFYNMRSNFATSLAAMSATQWILGVGDRHLQNILVCTRTGRAIGIDFGMSFGQATQIQTVPELVPFRLTPQMLNVFSPMKESGWFKQTMIEVFKTLCDDVSVLLAMLEVFVMEPTLDWTLDGKVGLWKPRNKIETVKSKLTGQNPVKYFENTLKLGGKQFALDVLKENRGGEVMGDNLTPEVQVQILLDLATDPLILSLIYVGWSSWL